jgi:hypothetical protein
MPNITTAERRGSDSTTTTNITILAASFVMLMLPFFVAKSLPL